MQIKIASYLIALLSVLLGSLAPQGFMPTRTIDGFSIELCSGHANKKLAITSDHPDYALLAIVYGGPEQQDTPAPETEGSVCTYAAASGATLLASAPTIALTDLIAALHEPTAERHFVIRNRINIPPATGPPATV
ncbi:MAG: hypothetical protein ABJP02_06080 [Parasphingorhabdus sp.]|uniref:hypothetical protein n=1 Tax=Parasphingorhabdus sp. TaxID=2709688 RepID=UPI0032983846